MHFFALIRAACRCPSRPSQFDRLIFGKEYKSWSQLHDFVQSPIALHPLPSNKPKYLSYHHVVKHPQVKSIPQCDTYMKQYAKLLGGQGVE
jgi:hypothetical protein